MATIENNTTTLSAARIRRDLNISRERMARLVDVSAKTIERWEELDSLPSNRQTRSLLAQIQEIVDLGLSVYSPAGFRRFLQTPLRAFQDRTPLQMIEQDQAGQVIAALASDYEGLGF